jgi:hypothetical protein
MAAYRAEADQKRYYRGVPYGNSVVSDDLITLITCRSYVEEAYRKMATWCARYAAATVS